MSAGDIEQEWVVGRCRAPFVMEEPEPHRPDLVLLLDVEAGRVSAFTTVSHDAPDGEVDGVLDEVRDNIRRRRPRRKVPSQPDESSSRVRRAFYEAAACFDDVAPWTLASDQVVMGVSIPKLGWTEACAGSVDVWVYAPLEDPPPLAPPTDVA